MQVSTRTMRTIVVASALAAGLATWLALAPAVSAHERRRTGPLEMSVGFGTEPAFAGEPNRVQLTLSRAGSPVTQGVDLAVEVRFGDRALTLALEPAFSPGGPGDPGDYGSDFIPTRPGPYTFRFTGTVGTQEIDESFTSGPRTFSEALDPAEVSFPAQDPTSAALADRIEADAARVAEARALAAAAAEEADAAGGLARVALVLGALGLLTGVAGFWYGRAARRKAA